MEKAALASQSLVDGRLIATRSQISAMSEEEIQRIVHELQVHQIELETQNEELKQAQMELSTARDQLFDLYDLAPIGYLTLDRSGNIETANLAASSLLKVERDRLVGIPFYSFVKVDDREILKAHLEESSKNHYKKSCEVHLIRSDYSTLSVRLESVGCCESKGSNSVRVAIVDFTDREKAETLLRSSERQLRTLNSNLNEANDRKDEFLAMLAHELRNPLSAMAAALRLWDKGDETCRKMSQEVTHRQLNHLTRLIDDLLDVSRITRGKILLHPETVDIVPIFKSALNTVNATSLVHTQRFSVSFPLHPVYVYGDPTRLEQIFTNVLSNAFKFTSGNGRIDAVITTGEKEVTVSVKDEGLGISKEMLPHIFELFQQANPTIDRKDAGLGIGLTVVQKLMQLHNGTLTAESPGEGEGSTFTLLFPLASLPCESTKCPLPTVIKRRRILVVEDNRDSGYGMKTLLQLEGHEVELAYDGHEGLDKARSFNPQVVILDIGLPDMDGYEVTKELRKSPQFKDTTIIALSGYGRDQDKDRAREAGFTNHLTKPVDFDRLFELLATT